MRKVFQIVIILIGLIFILNYVYLVGYSAVGYSSTIQSKAFETAGVIIDDFNDMNLYNRTNTYDCLSNLELSYTTSDFYDLSNNNNNNNNNNVDTIPLLTVISHGMGGGIEDWSNNSTDNFQYDDKSLVFMLQKLYDAQIYITKIIPVGSEKNAHRIFEKVIIDSRLDSTELNFQKVDNIASINNPIILLVEIDELLYDSTNLYGVSNSTNANIYDEPGGTSNLYYLQFNYLVSKVVDDIRVLNNGGLPKINLIGHSRGGLNNLRYALDHPQLVYQICSLATPYLGSTTADFDYNLLKSDLTNETTKDLFDKDVYNILLRRWNDNYDDLYSDMMSARWEDTQHLSFYGRS